MTLWCLIRIVVFLSIEEMGAGSVRRIVVGHQDDLLTLSGRPDRFIHGNDGGMSSPVICHGVSGDLQAL
jgi:hypothetical protein